MLENRLEQSGIAYEKCEDMDKMLALGLKKTPILNVDGELLGCAEALKWIMDMEAKR